jgi:tetratricopeptide (TPR) repeat protein
MNKASAQVRPRSADFLELAIGLETAGLFTQVQGSGGVSLTSMNQGLERIAALNQEYRKQRPEMGELVAITTDFLQRMIRNPKKGLCGAPLGQYLTRVRKILKADPDNPHALGLELPLAVAVNGIRGALPLMQKPLPTSFHGSTRDRLRLGRARMLLMAAVYLKRYELLDEAHYQLNNLEYERENDATAAEAEMIRGHVWAFRGLKEKWGRPGHHDQALSHYEKALGYLKSEQRPVALNNMLFLQIKSKPPYEVMRTVSRLKRQSLDSYQETLLLPNLTWLEKNPEAETVVSRIRAESGSRAYAMAMVLAGQRAWEQDRKDTARQLWRKAFQGVPLCDQLPLCRNCYMPDEVFVMGDFQWMLEYSVMDGLSMPANIRPEFWLVLPGGTGDGPGGWPSAAQIRGGDKPDTRFRW